MAFDYASVAADAVEALTEFGSSATLTSVTAGAYNTATGSATPTTTTQTVTAALFPYGDKMIDGTQIQAGDRQAFVGARGVTAPKPGDTLTWQAVVYRIVRVKDYSPAGTSVLFECQVRK